MTHIDPDRSDPRPDSSDSDDAPPRAGSDGFGAAQAMSLDLAHELFRYDAWGELEGSSGCIRDCLGTAERIRAHAHALVTEIDRVVDRIETIDAAAAPVALVAAADPKTSGESRQATRGHPGFVELKIAPWSGRTPIITADEVGKEFVSSVIQFRAYSYGVIAPDGTLWYRGGFHGVRASNDYHVANLRRAVAEGVLRFKQLPVQPKRPPIGDLGFGSGGGSDNIWYDPSTRYSEPQNIHGYCRQSFMPGMGPVQLSHCGVGWNEAANKPIVDLTFNAFIERESRFRSFPRPPGMPLVNLSDYDPERQGVLSFAWGDGHSQITVAMLTSDGTVRHVANVPLAPKDPVPLTSGMGEFGTPMFHLEHGVHLALKRKIGQAYSRTPYGLYRFARDLSGFERVTLRAELQRAIDAGEPCYLALDRKRRRAWWLTAEQDRACLWAAPYDDIGNPAKIGVVAGAPRIVRREHGDVDAAIGGSQKPILIDDDRAFIINTDGENAHFWFVDVSTLGDR